MRSGLLGLFFAVLALNSVSQADQLSPLKPQSQTVKSSLLFVFLETANVDRLLPRQKENGVGCTYDIKAIDETSFKIVMTQTRDGVAEKSFGTIVSDENGESTLEYKSMGLDITYKGKAVVNGLMEPQPIGFDIAMNTPVEVQLDIGVKLDYTQSIKMTVTPLSIGTPASPKTIDCKIEAEPK